MYQIIISIIIFLILIFLIFTEYFYTYNLFLKVNNLSFKPGLLKNKLLIQKISLMGIMMALNVGLSLFRIPIIPGIDYIQISSLPLLIMGFMYGPLYGYLTGILGNILYSLTLLHQGWNSGFILSSGINGLIPGLLIIGFIYAHQKNSFNKWWKITIAIILILIELSMILFMLINFHSFGSIENKLFHSNSIWANILFFGIGNLMVIEFLFILFILIKQKYITKFNNTILILVFLEQVVRLFIISLILDPIWIWEYYHVNYSWIKIIKFPIELLANILVAIPVLYIILKMHSTNFLYNIFTIYNRDNNSIKYKIENKRNNH